MNVYIGADHRGVNYKSKIAKALSDLNMTVVDMGAFDAKKPCDYPLIAKKVATNVAKKKGAFGVLVCMSGIGQTIAANKIKGARAALCYNAVAAKLSRQHNNANILVLSSRFVKQKDIKNIVKNFLKTSFEGGRHQRRVNQIKRLESYKRK